jgi:hypothetical protein
MFMSARNISWISLHILQPRRAMTVGANKAPWYSGCNGGQQSADVVGAGEPPARRSPAARQPTKADSRTAALRVQAMLLSGPASPLRATARHRQQPAAGRQPTE